MSVNSYDPLGVLQGADFVCSRASHVQINPEVIEQYANDWKSSILHIPEWDIRYHFQGDSDQTANWVLLLDALNFCFWGPLNGPKWCIKYKDSLINGYNAEAYALKRAILELNIPLFDAQYLSELTLSDIAEIFKPEPGYPEIPLIEQRLQNAREVGRGLLQKFDGNFKNLLEVSNFDAVKCIRSITETFPSFQDTALYNGRVIPFYKRAQICIADTVAISRGTSWGNIRNLEALTVFADYKLPQILRSYGILEYSEVLADIIDCGELIEPGSVYEVEIRASTIKAADLLKNSLANSGLKPSAYEIDWILWNKSQDVSNVTKPYHRCLNIYY